MELGFVANHVPLGMVEILFATFCISAGDLQVAVRIRADPDLLPCRWNGQFANPLRVRAIHLFSVGGDITEGGSMTLSLEAGPLIGGLTQQTVPRNDFASIVARGCLLVLMGHLR